MKLTLAQVTQAVHGTLHPPAKAGVVVDFAEIDTRRLQGNALFFALPGKRTDGHDHLQAAADAGARAAVVRAPQPHALPQVVVDDSAAALHQLAAHWRKAQSEVRIVAITGSNGKTTVKAMLHSILTAALPAEQVLASSGNFNNHLGVSLTLLQLKEAHELAVLEAGMDHAGELTQLSHLIAPQVVVINNAQRAHIGNFNSVRDIAEAKGELLAGLPKGGKAVLNADDPHFPLWRELAQAQGAEVVSFGTGGDATVRGEFTHGGIRINDVKVPLALPGVHNKMNALAAAAAAHALDLPMDAVAQGLSACTGVDGRLAMQQLAEGVTLIDDTYNANPDSAAAAINVLQEIAAQRQATPLLIMGDMFALGATAAAAHEELVAICKAQGVHLIGFGDRMHRAQLDQGYGDHYSSKEDGIVPMILHTTMELQKTHGDLCILVKGSRGMKMERVVHALVRAFGGKGA